MTCTHVLDLIDAGPFAGDPGPHLEAAWRHARRCPTCGPALEAARALTADLAALPRPAPPPDLSAGILARIAEIDRQRSNVGAAMAATGDRSSTRDWSPSITALGGLAAALAIVLSTSDHDASIRFGSIQSARMPSTVTEWLVRPAGLLLCAAGLQASVRRRWRRSS